MKKILFVIPFLSSGGAERVVSIWTSELAKLGSNVHLLVFYRVDNEYPVDQLVNFHSIAEEKSQYNAMSRTEKLFSMRKKFKDINPDIVLPFISHVGIMASIASIALPLKIVETIRIDPIYSPKNRVLRFLRNISVFFSKRCIVQNEVQKLYFPAWLQKRVVIFPNPISNEFTQNEKLYKNKEIRNIVAVGRLEKQKNYPMLINAFSRIAKEKKQITLRIYGEGSLYNDLYNSISNLKLEDRIILSGRTRNINHILQESDMYILSSDAEGMPNSLMEAMAVGLPCISTNCPTGPSELINDGINGYLIPVADEKALVDSMKSLINNIERSNEMGKQARQTILNSYTAKNSAEKLLIFLESI